MLTTHIIISVREAHACQNSILTHESPTISPTIASNEYDNFDIDTISQEMIRHYQLLQNLKHLLQ